MSCRRRRRRCLTSSRTKFACSCRRLRSVDLGGLTADPSPAGVHIHFCGNGGLRFRSYSGSLWQTPQSNQRSSPQASGTSPRLGVPSLRCPSGGIAYGLLRDDLLSMCPATPYGAARPPPDEHLHSASRRGGWIKINSGRRANARPVEWLGGATLFWVGDVRSSCRACEASFEDEVLANPGNTVFLEERGA